MRRRKNFSAEVAGRRRRTRAPGSRSPSAPGSPPSGTPTNNATPSTSPPVAPPGFDPYEESPEGLAFYNEWRKFLRAKPVTGEEYARAVAFLVRARDHPPDLDKITEDE